MVAFRLQKDDVVELESTRAGPTGDMMGSAFGETIRVKRCGEGCRLHGLKPGRETRIF